MDEKHRLAILTAFAEIERLEQWAESVVRCDGKAPGALEALWHVAESGEVETLMAQRASESWTAGLHLVWSAARDLGFDQEQSNALEDLARRAHRDAWWPWGEESASARLAGLERRDLASAAPPRSPKRSLSI